MGIRDFTGFNFRAIEKKFNPAAFYRHAGSFSVSILRENWLDETRERKIPVKIYLPSGGHGPFPVVVFSHGLGGSREGYAYLGCHWASHGFVCAHVQHEGTDKRIFENRLDVVIAMRDAVKNAKNLLNRPKDLRYCIDRMEASSRDPRSHLFGKIDIGRFGAAGHSMGAHSALVCSGRRFRTPDGTSRDLSDSRIRACVALSSPSKDFETSKHDYVDFQNPCLHMTGTKDSSPVAQTEVEDRRVPFDAISLADQFLINLQGGDHMVFSDHRMRKTEGDHSYRRRILRFFKKESESSSGDVSDFVAHGIIKMATTAFWKSYLNENHPVREWLQTGGLEKAIAEHASFESKIVNKGGD
jgi:predicted dienelactone hydrolase